ncbi:hypothetical protein GIB67_009733 [Kingdonia uniflora]|uniref:General transcription factor IIH subunit 2 n=1 Tax=Kingdonia uniflora TaxID=39325 RepID=A0A7J7LB45_9MAGN|nr:hypothetical protein GIB67_009733 [Kingdonia uniflora]
MLRQIALDVGALLHLIESPLVIKVRVDRSSGRKSGALPANSWLTKKESANPWLANKGYASVEDRRVNYCGSDTSSWSKLDLHLLEFWLSLCTSFGGSSLGCPTLHLRIRVLNSLLRSQFWGRDRYNGDYPEMRLEELIVALDEFHFKDLLLEHAPPPPAIAEFVVSNLIKMGFPQRGAEGVISICSCHKEVKADGGYTCPRCKAHVCELPTECQICGLTLVSSPHLARSYHHLFPITPFNEVLSALLSNPRHTLPRVCFGCQQTLPIPLPGSKTSLRVTCPKCNQHFCFDCDIYIHESLHNYPSCESRRHPKILNLNE